MFKVYVILTLINGGFVSINSQKDFETLDECNDAKVMVVEELDRISKEHGIASHVAECFPAQAADYSAQPKLTI